MDVGAKAHSRVAPGPRGHRVRRTDRSGDRCNASWREPRAIGGKPLPAHSCRGILILTAAFEPLRRRGGWSDGLENAAVPAIDSRALGALLRGRAGADRPRGPMADGT